MACAPAAPAAGGAEETTEVQPLSPEEAALAQKSLAQVAYSPDCNDAKACAPAEADLIHWTPVSELDEAMACKMMDQTEAREALPDGGRDGGVLGYE